MCLDCQLIEGNFIKENCPTQVIGFIVNLSRKCVEGMHMNWASYLVNALEKDCHEAQDQGYEFHFSCLLILISFFSCDKPKGATFLEVEPSEPSVARFTTLWYTSDMAKKWKLNAVLHA